MLTHALEVIVPELPVHLDELGGFHRPALSSIHGLPGNGQPTPGCPVTIPRGGGPSPYVDRLTPHPNRTDCRWSAVGRRATVDGRPGGSSLSGPLDRTAHCEGAGTCRNPRCSRRSNSDTSAEPIANGGRSARSRSGCS